MYFLVDCNQFFVSCELLFKPQLRGKPVVVLSSNDGCVVSRSKEAKALGIPMGAPAYQCQPIFRDRGVHVFSSNFALYADLSWRVMQTLSTCAPDMEEYSVDEAFLFIETDQPEEEALKIKKKVEQWTGIPVSIGIGPTKTLAKVANDLAKKKGTGIFSLTVENCDPVLQTLSPVEIWGVGKRLNTSLKAESIHTALQLKNAPDLWIKKQFSVVLLRTVYEVRGISCLDLEEVREMRKSLTHSRSFGTPVKELEALEEALSSFAASAAKKLRDENLCASFLSLFITTSPFVSSNYYANSFTASLAEPTSYTPLLIATAKEGLKKIYRPGFLYKKAGVILGGIVPSNATQRDLFSGNEQANKKKTKAMELLDTINHARGHPALQFAAEGLKKEWKRKSGNSSPRYTTSWPDLLTIKL